MGMQDASCKIKCIQTINREKEEHIFTAWNNLVGQISESFHDSVNMNLPYMCAVKR